jgi:sterol desaturase/sphingolipid hydroxylase (fatty acid hydroxylase superfamily)
MEKVEDGFRNARGEWRPPYPIEYAPVFCWPPKLRAFCKWLFGYPGYIFGWNLVFFFVTLGCWEFLQPDLASCATFRWEWITWLLLRNLALMWLFFGGWHLLLYTLKLQGTERKYNPNWLRTDDARFLFRHQLWDNLIWCNFVGLPIWTAYEVFFTWGYANHKLPTVSWADHPVYFVALMTLIPLWREFHFYWIHRLIHWKPIYLRVHYLHHKNVNPGPWSGLAMHPVEHIVYFSVVLLHLVVPSHPLHFLYDMQHVALGPAGGHHGFEGPVLKGKVPTGSYFHYLHHRYFECNYGESTVPLDKWFGTFRDGLPEGAGAKLQEEHKDTNRQESTL